MIEVKPLPVLQKIYELRKAKKISLEEISKAFGVETQAGASLIENGNTPLKVSSIYRIAALLGVKPFELFVEEDFDRRKEPAPLRQDESILLNNFRKILREDKRRFLIEMSETLSK